MEQPKGPMGEWIKIWYIHTMDDSVLERKGILTPPTTQKNLEDIMLNETKHKWTNIV